MADIEQPKYPPGSPPGVPKLRIGSKRSIAKLDNLRFDPIERLVRQYEELEYEVERQKLIRDGNIVEVTATGKPKAYRPEVHHALYDKMIKIGESLLRYKYGRVPETVNVQETRPMPISINLTKKGEVYQLGDVETLPQEDEEDE